MIILGCDVGVRNLGISLIKFNADSTPPNVIWAGVLDIDPDPRCQVCQCKAKVSQGSSCFCLRHHDKETKSKKIKRKKKSIFELATSLYEMLDRYPCFVTADEVALENQPCSLNPHLKTVQILLFAYFVRAGVPKVQSVAASHKFKVTTLTMPKEYSARKKLSIHLARVWLAKHSPNDLETFELCRKKDDYADALLISCWWAQHLRQETGCDVLCSEAFVEAYARVATGVAVKLPTDDLRKQKEHPGSYEIPEAIKPKTLAGQGSVSTEII